MLKFKTQRINLIIIRILIKIMNNFMMNSIKIHYLKLNNPNYLIKLKINNNNKTKSKMIKNQ